MHLAGRCFKREQGTLERSGRPGACEIAPAHFDEKFSCMNPYLAVFRLIRRNKVLGVELSPVHFVWKNINCVFRTKTAQDKMRV
jgi:Zn-finger protein